MKFDIVGAEKKIQRLAWLSRCCLILTLLLFFVPLIQLLLIGEIPIDITFFILTAINIALVFAAAKLRSTLKFKRYQFQHFTEIKREKI